MEKQRDLYKYISEDQIQIIVDKRGIKNKELIKRYKVFNASDKMLGFLCDYWRLKVELTSKKTLHYFLKGISIRNEAKAQIVQEFDLLEKERFFYEVIIQSIKIKDLKPFSPGFITGLDIALVFEDMSVQGYKLRDKFHRFDMVHTLEALKTLARFHASSITFEEKKSKELGRKYLLNEDFEKYLGTAGYEETDPWYLQCMYGALEAFKKYSKKSAEEITVIEKRWVEVWFSALSLADTSVIHRNVICHRDLWNNNIMFHYTDHNEPDNCILVDFPTARYQPPAGDVMLLLYCNLDPKFREKHLYYFLNFYIEELHKILNDNGVHVKTISKEQFLESAIEQRKWGIVIWACLLPLAWISDEDTLKYFEDAAQFDYIVNKNKASFIIEMMKSSQYYRENLMQVFEEIVERYCQ